MSCNNSTGELNSAPRPILKSGRSFDKSSTHLRWDEDSIRLHDAERGTRQKIDEPKTPYIHYDHSMEDLDNGVPPLELSEAIEQNANSSPSAVRGRRASVNSNASGSGTDRWTDSEPDSDQRYQQDDDNPERVERKRRFAQMRAQHYNMKEVLAKVRWEHEHPDQASHEEDVDNDSEADKERSERDAPRVAANANHKNGRERRSKANDAQGGGSGSPEGPRSPRRQPPNRGNGSPSSSPAPVPPLPKDSSQTSIGSSDSPKKKVKH